jgi:hypothetical protein
VPFLIRVLKIEARGRSPTRGDFPLGSVGLTVSDAGALVLVETVAKFQHRFDNTSDRADSIWEHIHYEFMTRVRSGELPFADGRGAAALQKRWNTELGEFRLWCATANRAVQLSGVPADQVEELVTAHFRVTTPLLHSQWCDWPPNNYARQLRHRQVS